MRKVLLGIILLTITAEAKGGGGLGGMLITIPIGIIVFLVVPLLKKQADVEQRLLASILLAPLFGVIIFKSLDKDTQQLLVHIEGTIIMLSFLSLIIWPNIKKIK